MSFRSIRQNSSLMASAEALFRGFVMGGLVIAIIETATLVWNDGLSANALLLEVVGVYHVAKFVWRITDNWWINPE